MNDPALRAVMTEARACAMAMLENAIFVQGELDKVHLDDELRARVHEAFGTLVGTKHDVMGELSELDELLDSDPARSVIDERVERIVGWIREDALALHGLVEALEAAKERDAQYGLAYVLVVESAANVLTAFVRLKETAEAWGGE